VEDDRDFIELFYRMIISVLYPGVTCSVVWLRYHPCRRDLLDAAAEYRPLSFYHWCLSYSVQFVAANCLTSSSHRLLSLHEFFLPDGVLSPIVLLYNVSLDFTLAV